MKKYKFERKTVLLLIVAILLIAASFMLYIYNPYRNDKNERIISDSQTGEVGETSPTNKKGQTGFVEYPIESETTLKIWGGKFAILDTDYINASESPFHTGLSTNTGINVEWSWNGTTDYDSAINLMIAQDNLPDIIIYDKLSDVESLIEAGYILPLNEYIEDYAPNLYNYINEYPEVEKVIKTDSGYYYMFPFLRENSQQSTFRGPVIRKDWLTELGLDIPKTIDDLDLVLKAFYDIYGGEFSTYQPWMNSSLIGAWGINRGYFVDDYGKIQCGEAQDIYRDFLAKMNEWYESGILDHDFATIDTLALDNKIVNNEIGFTITTSAYLSRWIRAAEEAEVDIDWIPIENFILEPGAMVEISQMENSTNGLGAIITTNCSDIEAAMRFLDWGYSEEGILYWNYGTEGVSYEMVDGEPIFKEGIVENELDKYIGMQWGGISIAQWGLFEQKNTKVAVDAVKVWTTNTRMAAHLLPLITATKEESVELNVLETALESYIDEMYYKFIMGEVSLNKFDEYIETLENTYKLSTVLAIKQSQLERYNNR